MLRAEEGKESSKELCTIDVKFLEKVLGPPRHCNNLEARVSGLGGVVVNSCLHRPE